MQGSWGPNDFVAVVFGSGWYSQAGWCWLAVLVWTTHRQQHLGSALRCSSVGHMYALARKPTYGGSQYSRAGACMYVLDTWQQGHHEAASLHHGACCTAAGLLWSQADAGVHVTRADGLWVLLGGRGRCT